LTTRYAATIYLLIGAGSALGGMARYWCSGFASRTAGETFPWGTLLVNVMGSAVIGFFATLTSPDGRLLVAPPARQFVMAGFCGGFTTFSTFSLETLNLARDGQWGRVLANVAGTLLLCLAGVWCGHAAAATLNQR
jgi:CrcB protein